MAQLLDRNFWIVNLLFVASACLLILRAGNAFVEGALLPLPGPNPKAPRAQSHPEPVAALATERLAELTDLPLPAPEADGFDSLAAPPLGSAPVRSSLPVRLLGTLVNELDANWSMASIHDATTPAPRTYMLHDVVQGAEIIVIERSRIIVINGDRREFIDGTNVGGPAFTAASGGGIRRLADHAYVVPSSEIDRTLADLNDLAAQARIAPAVRGGRTGFRLFSIRPDSIYAKVGLQDGDFIKRINGSDLTSPERALELYVKLREASRIEIELERNGSSVVQTYTIRR
jgi:general secretion pathway protein C